MAGESFPILIKELITLRERMKTDKVRREYLERRLPEMLEEQGMTGVKLEDGPQIYFGQNRLKAWPKKLADDESDSEAKERMYDTLRELDAGHLITKKETVSFNSLCAWVKQRLADGQPIPEEIDYRSDSTIQVRTNGWSPNDV